MINKSNINAESQRRKFKDNPIISYYLNALDEKSQPPLVIATAMAITCLEEISSLEKRIKALEAKNYDKTK